MTGGDVRLSSLSDSPSAERHRTDAARSSDSAETDDLRSARGVLMCALLGVGFWVVAIYVVRLIVH
jgi:hypothetical protein